MNLRAASDVLGDQVVRVLDPAAFMQVLRTGRDIRDAARVSGRIRAATWSRPSSTTSDYHLLICIMRDVTEQENDREKKESISRQTVEIADKVVDKQMRIVQEIASLLGETAAETKIALTKLKESISNE